MRASDSNAVFRLARRQNVSDSSSRSARVDYHRGVHFGYELRSILRVVYGDVYLFVYDLPSCFHCGIGELGYRLKGFSLPGKCPWEGSFHSGVAGAPFTDSHA